MATQREQVLAYLRSQSTAFDDDQLADALGVRRQTINVICRALAHKGDVMRYYDGHRHKLVNRLPNLGENVQCATKLDVQAVIVATNPRIGSFLVLESADAVDMFAYPGNIDLSEDIVKAAVKSALERDGWTTDVRFGRLHGIDINATRGNERIILEAKGEGSLDAMRVNYFLGALGELLQRMDSPSARYGLALPAHRQFTRLIARLPDWVCQRLGLCFYLVRPTTEGIEVGYVPPRTLHTGD